MDIIQFAQDTLGLKLFPVTKFILKTLYGIPLDTVDTFTVHTDWTRTHSTQFTEAQYLAFLHAEGRANFGTLHTEAKVRELVLVAGRISGKSLIAQIVLAYEAAQLLAKPDPQAFYGLSLSSTIGLQAFCATKALANILNVKLQSSVAQIPTLHSLKVGQTLSYTSFRSNQAEVAVKLSAKPCQTKSLRGTANLVVVLDDLAHYFDHGQNISDTIYFALRPSTSCMSPKGPDGMTPIAPVESRVLSMSTPLYASGMLHKLFTLSFQHPEDMLCLQIPSWEMNPSLPAEELAKYHARDPRLFDIEYGAQFLDPLPSELSGHHAFKFCPHCGQKL